MQKNTRGQPTAPGEKAKQSTGSTMPKRFPGSLTYIERCAYEVQWYEHNGKHPERIRKDFLGHKYVQSDFVWNRRHPHQSEHCSRAIANFINQKVTGIKA